MFVESLEPQWSLPASEISLSLYFLSYFKKTDEDSWSAWFFGVTQKTELRVSFNWFPKTGQSLKRRAILIIPGTFFLEEPMLFLLSLKWKLWEKPFSNVKTKTNSSFAVKVTERSNDSFLLFLSVQ